jgi:mediator of RNA polymerase II transcription subunit 5
LVDTFLLPSLVGALGWLADHLWSAHTRDSPTLITILQVLISPSSISTEAYAMLSSILNIVAIPLERSLRWLQGAEPKRQDVEPLSRILKPYLASSRTAGAGHTELEAWSATSNGGIAASVRKTIADHITWSVEASTRHNIVPTDHTHRKILAALKLLGASRVLQSIVEEVGLQTTMGFGSIALDVAVAIVCSPDPSAPPDPLLNLLDDPTGMINTGLQPTQRRLTLRDALNTAADQSPKTYRTDVLAAETTLRLFRMVEAQMVMPLPIPMPGVNDMLAPDVNMGSTDDPMAMMNAVQDMDHGMMGDHNGLDLDAFGDGMLDSGMGLVDDDDLFGDMM